MLKALYQHFSSLAGVIIRVHTVDDSETEITLLIFRMFLINDASTTSAYNKTFSFKIFNILTFFLIRIKCYFFKHFPSVFTEPGGWIQPTKAMDYDRRPPPATSCDKEHGIPEVQQHGAESIYKIC